jgi:hypothetical protein
VIGSVEAILQIFCEFFCEKFENFTEFKVVRLYSAPGSAPLVAKTVPSSAIGQKLEFEMGIGGSVGRVGKRVGESGWRWCESKDGVRYWGCCCYCYYC